MSVKMIGMMSWLDHTMAALLAALSIPQVGLGAVFLIAFVSATLLPMGSEPAVFALVKMKPEWFWPAILVATAGNTLGGILTWWMGRAAHNAADHWRHHEGQAPTGEFTASRWLMRYGPKACLLSWLPVVGDPLCAVAGWLRLPLLPCALYMMVGKLLRYITMTYLLIQAL